jgi:F0F1-type ATP synthase epsilon subunit
MANPTPSPTPAASQAKAMDALQVKIKSPEKILWEGEALSVSSKNIDGPFDILPMHANFISLVEGAPIRINTRSGLKEFTYERAVIYCHVNNVFIYTNL